MNQAPTKKISNLILPIERRGLVNRAPAIYLKDQVIYKV
jgi:hypothetical protein